MTDPWSEKIFDSLMEEMLTNQHPPDLTEQIQQRLREERGYAQVPAARAALQRSAVSQNSRSRSTHSDGMHSTSTRSASVRSASSNPSLSNWRGAAVASLTVAAGLLMTVSVWQLWVSKDSGDVVGSSGTTATDDATSASDRALASSSADGATKSPTSDSPKNGSQNALPGQPVGPKPASDLAASGEPSAAPAPREDLSLDNLPFNADDAKPALAHETSSVVALPVKAWSDEEVVSWLDERFNALWASKQVQPQERLAADAEAARVSLVLTGGALPPSSAPPRELATKLLRSATFAEHWADRVVGYWLRGTPAADKRDQAGAALRAAVAQQIVARKPWNEILAALIDSQPGEPEAVFLTLLASRDNHRLAGRVGSAVLDEALACARCHDASDNGRLISTDQDEYWSLVAIFTGIDSRDAEDPGNKQPGEKQVAKKTQPVAKELIDRQAQLFADGKAPNVFFDRPDGRLQAAHYRLPGGDHWRSLEGTRTPRESLARWIASTSVTDRAAVNTAWRLVYGRPLVAQHAALDGEGWAERREMLDTLALQFQAHGRDISQLVSWLISSEPFRTQPLAVDRQKWLLASDDEIARWNVASVNFASFKPSSTTSEHLASLESTVAAVVRWSGRRDERTATLAQPSPLPTGTKPQPKTAQGPGTTGKADDAPATYLVRSSQPSAAQSEYIKRLVSSKLTWPQQVEHIAGLVGESGKNGKLQQAADQLLEIKDGDQSAALFQLLQSALLCEEAL